jgi:CRP-like cAMP-binding protein
MTNDPGIAGNRILAGIVADGGEPPVTVFDLVSLPADRVLCEPGATPGEIYFPVSGLVSALAVSVAGAEVEAATVGREGIVGFPLFGGLSVSPFRLSVTIEGAAFRVSHSELVRRMSPRPNFESRLDGFRLRFAAQIAQTLLCNSLHTIVQRCCRWLLSASDRTASPSLPITHERLAELLGVRRPTVSEAIRNLVDRGLLEAARSKILIRDRPGLQAAACPCFAEGVASFDPVSEPL